MKKLFILLCIAVCLSFAAYAEIPHLINYQGRLTDSKGSPLDGTYKVIFKIFNVETGGAPLWTEEHAGEKGDGSILID